MKDNIEFTGHIEFLVLLITLLGGFYLLDGKIERQGERTDKLYEMFCDAQKDYNNKFDIINQRYIELRTENRK